MVRVTANIRLRAPSPFGAPSRHLSASGRVLRTSQQAFQPPPTPLSELLADRSIVPAERGPKPPGRSLRNRARAPHSLHQTVRQRLTPLMSEMKLFSSACGANSRDSIEASYPSDLMRSFSCSLFGPRAPKL